MASSPRTRVAALAVEGDRILLVRHVSRGNEYFLLPGGGVEPGESEAAALSRELLEETGLAGEPDRLLFITESVSPDKTRHILQKVYLARVSGSIGKSQDTRVAGALFMPRNDFKRIKFYPNIRDRILESWDLGFPGPELFLKVAWED